MNKIKRVIGLIAVFTVLSMPVSAQVFYLDIDGENNHRNGELESPDLFIIGHGLTQDQSNDYVPVGSGSLLLAAFGGAYLLGKKKKK